MTTVKQLVTFASCVIATPLWAARPFVTDDARLTNAGKCQLEAWTRQYNVSNEFWALPACNLTGNLEVTLGAGTFQNEDLPSHSRDYVFQAKTLLKPLATDAFGYGVAIGKIAHPDINPGPNQFGNTYLYVPVSYAFNNAIVLHTNIGLLKDKGVNRLKTTYGIGAEIPINTKLLGIAEMYGDEKQKPFYQIGLRYSVIPNVLQIDTTVGQQFDANDDTQWFSLGFRYTP